MKKIFILLFSFLGTMGTMAQDLSSYKYIIVPEKFEFQKESNQYRLNELTQFLLEKKGYSAIPEGEDFPEAAGGNPCEGLTAHVNKESGLFVTRLKLILKDCRNREVFVSELGDSRIKEYERAYNESLREAVESLPEKKTGMAEAIITAVPAANTEQIKEDKVTGEVVEKSIPGQGLIKPEVAKQENSTTNINRDKLEFVKGNGKYYLLKTNKGYNFFQQGMGEPFAALIQSSAGNNSYIYSSITSKGMARFDEQGNLLVELLDPETNALESIEYKLQP